MKLCVKKLYCAHCRRSVQAREHFSNGQDRIACSKCGQVIRVGNGIYWRMARDGETFPSSPGPVKKTKSKIVR